MLADSLLHQNHLSAPDHHLRNTISSLNMKMFVAAVLLMAALVNARPEPPVNQYLPPGYSTTQQDSFAPPPQDYDQSSNSISVESARNEYTAPSSQYGAPSNQYSAPSSQYGAPSSQYGAPSRSSNSNTRSSSRGQSQSSSRFGSSSAPARSYGAPAQTAAVFHSAQPAAQYSAPSSNYGAPAPSSNYGAPSTGYAYAKNNADDDLSEPANYEFSYNVMAAPEGGEFGHRESRNGDFTKGSYEVVLPDGRKQIVDYEADANGYRPTIRYEEPQGGYNYPSAKNSGGPY